MKKTLLAIAVAGLFGAQAQAVTVYDADGTTLAVGGDIEVSYSKAGNAADASDAMGINDADVNFVLTQTVSEGLAVMGKVAISGDDGSSTEYTAVDSNGDDVTITDGDSEYLDTAILGLVSDTMGTITFGTQTTIKDDSGIFNDDKLGITGAQVNAVSSGDQVIKYKIANDTVYFGAAYAFNIDTSEDSEGVLNAIDANFGYTGIENVELVAYVGSTDVTEDEAETYIQVQASIAIDNLTLSGLAGATDYDGESGSGYGAQIAYAMDKYTFAVGAGSADTTDIGGSEQADYFVGVRYQLASTTHAYAQVGGSDLDGSETGFAVGLDMSF